MHETIKYYAAIAFIFGAGGLCIVAEALDPSALPTYPVSPDSRGWQYGGANCGCFGSNCDSRECCDECCADWYNNATTFGSVTCGDLTACQAFCEDAIFPCVPSCPWWNPFCWF